MSKLFGDEFIGKEIRHYKIFPKDEMMIVSAVNTKTGEVRAILSYVSDGKPKPTGAKSFIDEIEYGMEIANIEVKGFGMIQGSPKVIKGMDVENIIRLFDISMEKRGGGMDEQKEMKG